MWISLKLTLIVCTSPGVLGTPESNDAEIYTAIADILLKEEIAEKMISPTTLNYCKLIFTALNFDVSSGDGMYASLEQGK